MTNFEKEILDTAKAAIHECVGNRLKSGYNDNPLNKMIDQALNDHSEELRKIINDGIASAILTPEFKQAAHEAFVHKLAKVLVSKLEGGLEKATNSLNQDPTIRARMVLAIQNIVDSAMTTPKP